MLAFLATPTVVRLSSEDSREQPREGHPFDTQNTLDNTPVAVVKEPEAGVAQESEAGGSRFWPCERSAPTGGCMR